MHEEDYAEEEHGQATANLGDDGEGFQVSRRYGLIRRSLQRAKMKHYITWTGINEDGLWWISLQRGEMKNEVATECNQDGGMSIYVYSTGNADWKYEA